MSSLRRSGPCALLLGLAQAVSAFDGRVVARGGAPVAGAEVLVLGRPGGAITDAEGRFTLQPDPRPPFEVLVVLPGGRTAPPMRIDTLSATEEVVLEVDLAFEDAVTVTAGAAPRIESTPASGTSLLGGREIAIRVPQHLTQLLENVAGVSSVSEGPAAVPAVRGLAKGRTVVLIDGARVTAERRVGPSASFLDPATLEAVEVSRGPGSVAYGSDAFGGVIHARTRRAEPGSGFGGRATGSWGAGVPARRIAGELTRGHARGGVIVQGHYRGYDDYRSPEGEVFNSGARDFGVRARGDHSLGAGVFSLAWQSDLGRDIERPRDDSRTVRFSYPSEDSHRFVAAYETGRALGFNRLGASAFLGRYAIVTDQDRFAAPGHPRGVERADVSARDFHLRGFADRPLGSANLELGLDLNGRYGLRALDVGESYDTAGALARTTTSVSIDDARRVDAGVYANVRAAARSWLAVGGGLRADRVTTANRGGHFGDRETANDAVSGYAAVTVGSFGGFDLTAQAARGFRDPLLSDRYFRGPTGRGFITGEPGLASETSLQLDVAARYASRRWRAAAYAYNYRIVDLIERYQTETDFFFFRNRGRARLHGLELEAQAEPVTGWRLEVAGHLMRGRALDDGSFLDDVPPLTVTGRITRDFGRGFAQVRGAWYGEDDRPGPTEQARESYRVLDLAGGWRVRRQLELRALFRNLLDEAYRASPDARATLAPGRSLALTAALTF
jgi:outer membrane receptor protein involved in Fe transport